jgi:hypothetical protein
VNKRNNAEDCIKNILQKTGRNVESEPEPTILSTDLDKTPVSDIVD